MSFLAHTDDHVTLRGRFAPDALKLVSRSLTPSSRSRVASILPSSTLVDIQSKPFLYQPSRLLVAPQIPAAEDPRIAQDSSADATNTRLLKKTVVPRCPRRSWPLAG